MPNHRSHCPHCPKTFRTSNSLQNHLSLYHRNFRRKRGGVTGHDQMDDQQVNQFSQQLNQKLNQHLSQQLNQQINQQINQHFNQQLSQLDIMNAQEQLRLELDMRRRQDGRIDMSRSDQDVGNDLDHPRDSQMHHQQQQQQQQSHPLPPVSASLQTM